LADCKFGTESCKLRLQIGDNFVNIGSNTVVIDIHHGMIRQIDDDGDYEASIAMNIADFSSLLTGAVGFRSLLNYGLAQLSDRAYADKVHRLFAVEHKPRTDTWF
jgi:predicted acetyltransferase